MRGRPGNERRRKTPSPSSDLTCEERRIGGTSCSLHVMTRIIGSLMGSLALSVQPATPYWRTRGGERGERGGETHTGSISASLNVR